jgi:hypothetical protein
MITVDIFYAVCYAFLAAIMVGWYIHVNKENAEARYYYLGRRDGWNMHRRMIENKVKTDEVFDYDKQN